MVARVAFTRFWDLKRSALVMRTSLGEELVPWRCSSPRQGLTRYQHDIT